MSNEPSSHADAAEYLLDYSPVECKYREQSVVCELTVAQNAAAACAPVQMRMLMTSIRPALSMGVKENGCIEQLL